MGLGYNGEERAVPGCLCDCRGDWCYIRHLHLPPAIPNLIETTGVTKKENRPQYCLPSRNHVSFFQLDSRASFLVLTLIAESLVVSLSFTFASSCGKTRL